MPVRLNTRICLFPWTIMLVLVLMAFIAGAKDKLEITGQKKLTTERNTPLTLHLSDFTVSGSGSDRYPDGFALEVFNGNNYSVSGATVIPAAGFTGSLKVKIRISNDRAETKKTEILIDVVAPPNTAPVITGQTSLRIERNTPITIQLTHLTVVDPDDNYPGNFSLTLRGGDNYSVAGHTITPATNFTGTLTVPTIVNDGRNNSNTFALKIVVYAPGAGTPPPAQAPYFSSFSEQSLSFSVSSEAMLLGREIVVSDNDSPDLMYAEIRFDPGGFMSGKDLLLFDDDPSLTEVFDVNNGILVFFGKAPLSTYQRALRSVRYLFNNDTVPDQRQRLIRFTLNDGENASEARTKTVLIQEGVELDIPNVFSPNNDNANDLWDIQTRRYSDNLLFTLRVFDKRGQVVFETRDASEKWDGKHNGSPVPADTYFYSIEVVTSGSNLRRQGAITVLH